MSTRIPWLPLVLMLAACGDENVEATEDDGGNEGVEDSGAAGDSDSGGSDAGDGGHADGSGAGDPLAELVDVAFVEDATGAHLQVARGESRLKLRPVVHANGSPEDAGACTATATGLDCRFESGTYEARLEGGVLKATFRPGSDITLEGIELVGTWENAAPTAFLSNGFQSWSQTGFVALGEAPTAEQLRDVLLARGDAEVMRDGRYVSWFYSALTGDPESVLVAGVTGPGPFRPWIGPARIEGVATVRLVQGVAGESLALGPGETIALAPWSIQLAADAQRGLERYASRCVYLDDPDAVELGWNSWYELWNTVDAEAVLANAARARALLGGGSGEGLRIVIDDGWQREWGDWQPNEKFADGIDGLVEVLEAQGHEVGIWFAPLLASVDSEVFASHPEWFVEDVSWNHILEGEMRILDVTNPEAATHLTGIVETMRGWGLTLLKIDFLFAGTFEGGRDEAITGMMAYDRAMRVLAEAAGDDITLLAVGAPPIATFPYAAAWRVGPDIAVSTFGPSWPFVAGEARTIAGRYMFCAHTACDGDPALLRELDRNEVEVGQWVAALAGGAFFLSDDLRALETERDGWLLGEAVALGIAGTPAVPIDLVPSAPPRTLATALSDEVSGRNRHVVPTAWRLPDGGTIYFNWSDTAATIAAREVAARSFVVVR